MDTTQPTRRFHYELPLFLVILSVIPFIGLSLFMMLCAWASPGLLFVVLCLQSVIFGAVGLALLTRYIKFPRMLELTEEAILFPRGFFRVHQEVLSFADIHYIGMYGNCLVIMSKGENFTIEASRFKKGEYYRIVRDAIFLKTSVSPPDCAGEKLSFWTGYPPGRMIDPMEFPNSLVHWKEPEIWICYQRHIRRSKPVLIRLGREIWFFVKLLGFIFLPWLIISKYLPASSFKSYLMVAVPVTLFFTVYHWLLITYPGSIGTRIIFRDQGITKLFLNRMRIDWNYSQFLGWTVLEREYKGRILYILLLMDSKHIIDMALPDTDMRDRVMQILNDKQVPQISVLKLSWEAK